MTSKGKKILVIGVASALLLGAVGVASVTLNADQSNVKIMAPGAPGVDYSTVETL